MASRTDVLNRAGTTGLVRVLAKASWADVLTPSGGNGRARASGNGGRAAYSRATQGVPAKVVSLRKIFSSHLLGALIEEDQMALACRNGPYNR